MDIGDIKGVYGVMGPHMTSRSTNLQCEHMLSPEKSSTLSAQRQYV